MGAAWNGILETQGDEQQGGWAAKRGDGVVKVSVARTLDLNGRGVDLAGVAEEGAGPVDPRTLHRFLERGL